VTVSEERLARIALSFLADPGDTVLGAALDELTAAQVLAATTGTDGAGEARLVAAVNDQALPPDLTLAKALRRWRARLTLLPSKAQLDAWQQDGLRLIVPGDPEFPTQLDDLGTARPVVLWLRGSADLRFSCMNSVAVVGARAATHYGQAVAVEFAASLAERGVTVLSGGAFGVDAAAHRGALAADGLTVAVLAGGLNFGYPRSHESLFAAIAAQGVLVSECPPDQAPTRPGFLVRNRLIAALSRGTVVVEAAGRSGALNTARHARELCRPVMAVPGPVTSELSAGCHELIREYGAMCVTCARDVLEHLAPSGTTLAGADDLGGAPAGPGQEQRDLAVDQEPAARRDPAVPQDQMDAVESAVLDQVPARRGRGVASIAAGAGVDVDTAMQALGLLAAAGYVERCEQGWRARRAGR
jgi:DNA processing protein